MMSFAWYAIHRETKFVIAGFVSADDASKFCASFTHGMYVVRDSSIVHAMNDPQN